jgi:hypothetical protein
MDVPDAALPLVATRQDARAAGFSDAAVGRRLTSGGWVRLRQGWFSPTQLADESRWRAEVLAALRAHRRLLVLSHASAARAHGWPVPVGGWGPTTFTSPVPPARRRAGTRVLVSHLAEHDVEPCGAVLVTSRARTVVDCARALAPHDALAIADAALRAGLPRSQLAAALAAASGRRGVEQARSVLRLADGRRESALESWSAWALSTHGLSPTLWQATLLDSDGVFLGRADAWWAQGVVGEADGRTKYRLAALERSGAVDAEGLAWALDEERAREREMRRAGAAFVRWAPRDVLQPARTRRLALHVQSQLDLASATRMFTGRVLDLR